MQLKNTDSSPPYDAVRPARQPAPLTVQVASSTNRSRSQSMPEMRISTSPEVAQVNA
jgi:hypothetical protein